MIEAIICTYSVMLLHNLSFGISTIVSSSSALRRDHLCCFYVVQRLSQLRASCDDVFLASSSPPFLLLFSFLSLQLTGTLCTSSFRSIYPLTHPRMSTLLCTCSVLLLLYRCVILICSFSFFLPFSSFLLSSFFLVGRNDRSSCIPAGAGAGSPVVAYPYDH